MTFHKALAIGLTTLSIFSHPGYAETSEPDYSLVKEKVQLPVLTPSLAQRKTQKLRLKNGLEVYLVSDPKVDLSGAMISVKAGSWEDPADLPGLAHFLEHMLFMGTLKYPNESEYDQFITEHGGQTNAFTTNSSTNYLFTVNNQAFGEALARFSSFFKEPLFNASGVSREMQAIDQEYAKNLEDDSFRQLFVLKELASPNHPLHHFNIGNTKTLNKATREDLEKWFKEHYSANLMRLMVISPLPLDTIRKIVVEQFSPIQDKKRSALAVTAPAFPPEENPSFTYIEPVKDTRTLTIVWELPPKFAHMKLTQPESITSLILGDEGEKSLLAQLKRENLAESLGCGGSKLGDDLMLIYLQVELTQEGLRDIDQVVTRCFQTIANLRDKGVPQYLFDELKTMGTINYQYQSSDETFPMLMKHAFQIQDEELTTYPEHTEIIQQFDPQAINELLSYLKPKNARYLIMAPSAATQVTPTTTEKWMGVKYARKAISKDLLEKWTHVQPHTAIDLPPPNIFIPSDLKLAHSDFAPNPRLIPTPQTITNNERGHIYFVHDDKFGVPKINWTIHLRTPQITMSEPISIALGDLFVKNVKENLNKLSYPAKMAGLEYDLTRENNGVKIEITGYSQNASKLLGEVLTTLLHYEAIESKVNIIKDSLLRDYLNFAKEKPVEQSIEIFKSLLYKEYVTEKEKAMALRKVTFQQYEDFVQEIFDQVYVESMLYGNMTEKQARETADLLNRSFTKGIYPKSELEKDAVIVLPANQGPYFLESLTKSQGNAVLLAIENPTFTFKERAAQEIIMQAIKEPFFSSLRTQQQTGYLVQSLSEEVERKLFNLFAVQSNTHDVRDLLSRFEQFIETYLQGIGKENLQQNQYDNIKRALFVKYTDPAKNLKSMGALLDNLAFKYDGDFNWIQKRVDALRELTYPELLTFTKSFLGKSNRRRLAILLKGEIPEEHSFTYQRARTWNLIRKISDYETR